MGGFGGVLRLPITHATSDRLFHAYRRTFPLSFLSGKGADDVGGFSLRGVIVLVDSDRVLLLTLGILTQRLGYSSGTRSSHVLWHPLAIK